MKTKSSPVEELEYLRRRLREQERALAEHDRQEARHRQDLSRLAEAFGPARIRAWRWAVDTRLTQYLPTHASALGSRGEPVGTTVLDEKRLLNAIHPDDRQNLASVWNRAYAEHTPYETEYRVLFTDGEVRHNHEIGRPEFDESGRYLGHVGTTQDITARKQAENALRAAHDTLEQRVSERTVALEREIGERKRAEETLLANEHALQERVAALEEAHSKLELQAETLTRLANDLLVARDEARAADRTKSEFLATMSHELRTPLNAIIGFSEVIKDQVFGPVGVQYRDYSKDIHESGQHLLGLINDILDLSKIESGKGELYEDIVNVPEIIRSAVRLMGPRVEDGKIKLQLELPDQLPALRADERKLRQILVNLLANAIKFTEADGEVALWAWCRMGSGYVFQIADTGIGIAPEDIPKALSRFGQVDGDLSRRYEGAGLGLPLTKALVELHGGTLELQSEVGVGTTVTVRFPTTRIVTSPANADSLDLEDRAAS